MALGDFLVLCALPGQEVLVIAAEDTHLINVHQLALREHAVIIRIDAQVVHASLLAMRVYLQAIAVAVALRVIPGMDLLV